MNLRIQTRISTLIGAFTVLFVVMLSLNWESEREQLQASLAEREVEQGALLDRVLHLSSRSLKNFVRNYAVWDDVSAFMRMGDQAWAAQNIVPALRTFEAQAVWLYDENLARVYSANSPGDSVLTDLPMTCDEMRALLSRHPSGWFFVLTALGPMEIHFARIQPGFEKQQQTDPRGYVFAGRVWSADYIADLSQATASALRLGSPSVRAATSSHDLRRFTVTHRLPLRLWNGQPLLDLTAVREYPGLLQAYRDLRFFFVVSVLFVSLIMLTISLFLFRYVTRPLRQITASLTGQNPSLLPCVPDTNPEFATLAGRLAEFFLQEKALQVEIEQRRRSEAALRESEKRFRDLADLLPLIIFETDELGRITFLSRKAVELLGLESETLPENLSVLDVIAPGDRARAEADLTATLADRTPPGLIEYRGLRRDGTTVNLAVDACPIIRDGEICGIRGFAMDVSKSKADLEALRENRELLHTLIETAPLPICVLDREGRVQGVWNPAAETLFGWKKTDVFRTFAPMVPEELREVYVRDMAKLWEGKPLFEVEVTLRNRDGDPMPVTCFGAPLRDAGGSVNGVVAILVDRSEHKRAVQALRESEERFRNLSDTAPVLIWMAGVDRHCYYFNKTWLTFTGRSLAHEYGKGWTAGVHPDDLEPCLQAYRSASAALRSFSVEFRLRSAAGEYLWMLDRGTPRFAADGGFVGYIGTCTDISDRRQAEEALRGEKEKMQRYLDIVDTIVLAINADETVSLINQTGCRLLGIPEQEVRGKNWFDNFLPEEERAEVRRVFARLMSGEIEPCEYAENKVLTRDGQERTVRWRNTVLRDKTGRIAGTLSSGEVITECKPAATAQFVSHHLEALRSEIDDALHRVHASTVSRPQDKWNV